MWKKVNQWKDKFAYLTLRMFRLKFWSKMGQKRIQLSQLILSVPCKKPNWDQDVPWCYLYYLSLFWDQISLLNEQSEFLVFRTVFKLFISPFDHIWFFKKLSANRLVANFCIFFQIFLSPKNFILHHIAISYFPEKLCFPKSWESETPLSALFRCTKIKLANLKIFDCEKCPFISFVEIECVGKSSSAELQLSTDCLDFGIVPLSKCPIQTLQLISNSSIKVCFATKIALKLIISFLA